MLVAVLDDFVAQVHDELDESLEVRAIGFDFVVAWVRKSAFVVLPILRLQVSVGEKGLLPLSRG